MATYRACYSGKGDIYDVQVQQEIGGLFLTIQSFQGRVKAANMAWELAKQTRSFVFDSGARFVP